MPGAKLLPALPSILPPLYDQTFGATDANGYVASLPFRATTAETQVFVDSNPARGDDTRTNAGYSPYPGFRMNGTGSKFQYGATGQGDADATYGPAATVKKAMSRFTSTTETIVTPGAGNQLFLAEGGTYDDPSDTDSGGAVKRLQGLVGFSAQYPFVIQSYPVDDPLNLTKHGRALGASRPKFNLVLSGNSFFQSAGTVNATTRTRSFYAFRGIQWQRSDGAQEINAFNFTRGLAYTLWENCFFSRVHLNIGTDSSSPGNVLHSRSVVIRRNAFRGVAGSGNSGCIHSSAIIDLVLEDNVFAYGGWDPAVPRSYPIAQGGANILKHDNYLSANAYGQMIVRRNFYTGASATGISARDSNRITDNVFAYEPIGTTMASVQTSGFTEIPNGVLANHDRNFFIGADDTTYTTIAVTGVPVAGTDTLTVGPTTFAFIANGATPAGNQIAVGTSALATAQAIADALNTLYPVEEWFTNSSTTVHRRVRKTGNAPAILSRTGTWGSIPNGLPRAFATSSYNNLPGSTFNNNLLVNNSRYAAGVAPAGAVALTSSFGLAPAGCTISYANNSSYAYNDTLVVVELVGGSPEDRSATNAGGNVISSTSPASNDAIFVDATGFPTFDDAIAYIIAHPEISWSSKFQATGTKLFGHSWGTEKQTIPSLSVPGSLSTSTPTTGGNVTLTLPTFDFGAVGMYQWFADVTPLANTRNLQTITVPSGQTGKKLRTGGFFVDGNGVPRTFFYEASTAIS